jgi:O-Antigen ligase
MMLKINSLPGKMLMQNKIKEALSSISPVFIGIFIIALALGITLGIKGSYVSAITIGASILIITLLLRQYEWIAMFILVFHLYVDWYLGMLVIALALTCLLLVILFLERSVQYPWSKPRALWLWGIFLLLAIFPAFHGSLTRYDAAFYYPNIIFGALIMFWMGILIAKDMLHTRRFFKILALVGALLALITIFQDRTGILLFGSSRFDAYMVSVSDFNIFQGSDAYRLGSFFVNPDWNGAFFAFMLSIPLGLFIGCDFFLEKALCLAEAFVLLPALLFTYSVGAWISAGVGIIVFIVLSGRISYRIGVFVFLVIAAIILCVVFPTQILLLFQRGSDPIILLLREGAWKTSIAIMKAFPLTGIGFGLQAYMLRAEPYRDPEQYRVLAHPHNSYLELGAMAGLPILICFVALILFALQLALRNWRRVERSQCPLLGCGIAAVIALSLNSFSVNAWTLPPLAAFGWVILGVVSSPLLKKSLGERV